jgi:hypothetical protein
VTVSGIEWLVVLGGIAAIGWVNWYFFFAGRRARRADRPRGGNEEQG